MTYDQVVAMALELCGVKTSTSWGTPSLKVREKLLARLCEPDILVLMRVADVEQRMLVDTHPAVYFTTAHNERYPSILIRLSKADPADVRELIERSWSRLAGPKLLKQLDQAGTGQPR